MNELAMSLRLLKTNFLDNYDYPVLVFVENDFLPEWKAMLASMVEVRFIAIEFRIPSHIEADEVPEFIHGFPVGYRHMCQFFSVDIFRHAALNEFDWYLRLDTDSYILSRVDEDCFERMERDGYLYGHINTLEEIADNAEVVEGLWETTCKFATQEKLDVDKIEKLCDDEGDWKRGIYYTNFELTNIHFWRRAEVQSFLDHVDQEGGIYNKRWGDAPIHTLAVNLFMEEAEIHLMENIEYLHQDTHICIGQDAVPWKAPEGLFDGHKLQDIFTKIYEENIWGGGSGCGARHCGSYPLHLEAFIYSNKIRSIVDFGCGDWDVMKGLSFPQECTYLGIDIVEHIVKRNSERYSRTNILFRQSDTIDVDLAADLLIIKDVLQHLSFEHINSILAHLPRFRYALITNDYCEVNVQCHDGDTRPLNLLAPPFRLDGQEVLCAGPKRTVLWMATNKEALISK